MNDANNNYSGEKELETFDEQEDLELFEVDDDEEEIIINSNSENAPNVTLVNGVFQNVANIPLKNIQCIVTKEFMDMMRNIEYNVTKSLGAKHEFGAYIKGFMDEDGIFKVMDEIYIPAQEVTAATIDFKENPPDGYNGVIHRHPNGCVAFSGTDDKYINSNFEFSLLYESNTIRQSIINIKIDEYGKRLQVPMKVCIESKYDVQIIDVSMIKKVIPTFGNASNISKFGINKSTQKKPITFGTDPERYDAMTMDDIPLAGWWM